MKLCNATMRPGSVIEILDNGKIKAEVSGLFNSVDDTSLLPPIYPFVGGNINSFSSLEKYDDVWVINFTDNPLELFWIRKDDKRDDNKELLDKLKDNNYIDIVVNREIGPGMYAQIYFTDGTGWIINNGNSKIVINSDGEISMNYQGWPNRTISIGPKGISLGTIDKSIHPAVLGDNLIDILGNIIGALNGLAINLTTNGFTAAAGASLAKDLPEIQKSLPGITSMHVTLD